MRALERFKRRYSNVIQNKNNVRLMIDCIYKFKVF